MKKLCFILTVLIHLDLYSQNYKGVWFYDSHKANPNSANPKNNQGFTDGTDQVEFNTNVYLHPSLKGVLLFFGWDDLQPSVGTYKWSYLDNAINDVIVKKNTLKIGISIWTGKYSPDWLYQTAGIDTFRTSDSTVYPDYLDKQHHPSPNKYTAGVNDTATTPYERFWRNMIDSLINHLNNNYSQLYNNHILFIQASEGSTSDLAPYKGTPKDSFKIDNYHAYSEWQLFVKRCWAYTASKMRNAANLKDSLHLLLNTGAPAAVFYPQNLNYPNLSKLASASDSSIFKWVTNATSSDTTINNFLKKSWRKADGQGHWYQLNYEYYFRKAFADLKATNSTICTRDEFDLSTFKDPLGQPDSNNKIKNTCANASNIFATAANALNADLDIWCILSPQLYDSSGAEITKNTEVFNMFNTLKQIEALSTAPSSAGAYCFLKDGLDANDFSRFTAVTNPCSPSAPTPEFGDSANAICSKSWCRNIAAYKYKTANLKLLLGAQQLDSDYAQGVPAHQYLGVRDYNDVGWYTFNSKATVDTGGVVLSTTSYGNSEKFMHQQNANLRSVGSYGNATRNANIGSYGRFGRYIVSTTDSLSFDVNDNLGSSVCGAGTTKVYKINVVYMDDSSGSKWQLYFNNATDNNKTFDTFMVVNNGSHGGKGWKIVTFSAGTCITFANSSSGANTDFYIRNTDTIADKFAFIYITTSCLAMAGCSINNPAFGKATWSTSLFPSSFTAGKQDIIYSTYATSAQPKTSLVSIFPNPALDYTTVMFNNAHTKCTLILSNMQGKQLYQKTLRQINKGMNEKISLKGFAKGIYFLKISCDDEAVQTEKIIVE